MIDYIINHIYLNVFGLVILVSIIYYLGKASARHGSLKQFIKDVMKQLKEHFGNDIEPL